MMENRIRVGIITMYYTSNNCGGLLQAFALCDVLNTLEGSEAEQICLNQSIFLPTDSLKTRIRKYISFFGVRKFAISVLSKFIREKKIATELQPNSNIFRKFEHLIPHSETVYSYFDIEKTINQYDIFITGSDQVWNWVDAPEARLNVFFLRFVPDDKLKIAYAPSIACPYIPDNLKQYYYDSINRLDAVSIREKSSLDLFPDDLRKKITPVCDPTLLLNGEQWCKSLNLDEKKTEQYIFLYLLNPSKSDRKIVKRLSKITGLKVITSPNITMSPTSYDYHLADIDDFNMGPKEFVNYIKDASLVLTNSFHAAVFSIQFHTPFYVIKRESKVSMSSRLDSLLDDYGLKDRQISETFDEADVSGYDSIDWDRVDSILNKNREFSIQWLKNALTDVEK